MVRAINSAGTLSTLVTRYQFYPYHVTQVSSPWPILTAQSVLSMLLGMVFWFNAIDSGSTVMTLGLITTLYAWVMWFKDITVEGTYLGDHTQVVQKSLSLGVTLFIVTEAFFFVSIFWAYLHSSLAPTIELGSSWPPAAIEALSPYTIPLLNTILLVSSGAFVTYAHHAMIRGVRSDALIGALITVLLAVLFTALQGYEYAEAGFSIADGAFGTVFYFGTGFHGAHVLVGTLFIAVGLGRLYAYHLTSTHHVGLEAAILYWHFVDVVWLFLYAVVYCWGS